MKEERIIWQPSDKYLKSRVADFANQHGIEATDWRQLIKKSTDDIEWFWNSFLEFADMQWSQPYKTLLDQSQGLPWTKWFIGGRTNIAYNCLDWHLSKIDSPGLDTQSPQSATRHRVGSEHLALIWENEAGESLSI